MRNALARLSLFAIFFCPLSVRAQPAPEQTLYPRVETGLHEADINAMVLLPDGHAFATVSDDKSARIWSVDALAPKGIVRPPIGPRDDGALYAVAANARILAVAGRVRDLAGHFAIQIFSLPDMRPLGSVNGLPAPIFALAFSPSGGMLAAGMIDDGGIRFFDLRNHVLIPPDPAYHGSVTGMAFDPTGRLAVAAKDAALRLYDPDGHRLGDTTKLRAGAQPFGVAFSPDGSQLAVGDRQHAVVHLFSVAAGGKLTQLADLQGVAGGRTGSFDFVAFSADGKSVLAAGSYKDAAGQRYIRRWALDSRTASETAVAADTITGLLPAGESLLFTTAEPAIGRLDAGGHVAAHVGAHHIDFRNAALDSFHVSPDGATISMPLSGQPQAGQTRQTLLFNVQTRRFVSPDAAPPHMTLPLANVAHLVVTEWFNSHAPKVNGTVVPLERDETTHAVAVAPDGSGAALATDFFVRFVRPGGQGWSKVVTSAAWAVNISGDGRLVVVGLGDGTVHWYDTATGSELLALYVDPPNDSAPKGHFVVWTTPGGFFDHDHPNDDGPDGRALIGYQFNSVDHRSSSFIQIGQLYGRFFRPDLVGLAFRNDQAALLAASAQQAGDAAQAIASGLPPQIVIVDKCGRDASSNASGCPATRPLDRAAPPGIDLQTTAEKVLVQWKVTDPSGKPGSVRVQRNGAVLAPDDVFVDDEDTHSRTEEAEFALGDGLNTIRLTPFGAGGAVEAASTGVAELKLFRETIPQAVAARPPKRLYVLSVGVSKFSNEKFNLRNADGDATALADLMQQASPPVYDRAIVKSLLNQDATAANIMAALTDIAAHAEPDDLVLVFLAGHGQQVGGKYYFAPADMGTANPELLAGLYAPLHGTADPTDQLINELYRREGLGQDQLLSVVQTIKASRLALILDTCFSAYLATEDAVLQRDLNATVTNGIGHAAGRFVLSSAISLANDTSQADETALPADEQGHGLFTSYLLQALRGDENYSRRGLVDVYNLASYTVDKVQAVTARLAKLQEPTYFFNGSQFFALHAIQVANSAPAPAAPTRATPILAAPTGAIRAASAGR
jgi:WD40 repeat protein